MGACVEIASGSLVFVNQPCKALGQAEFSILLAKTQLSVFLSILFQDWSLEGTNNKCKQHIVSTELSV